MSPGHQQVISISSWLTSFNMMKAHHNIVVWHICWPGIVLVALIFIWLQSLRGTVFAMFIIKMTSRPTSNPICQQDMNCRPCLSWFSWADPWLAAVMTMESQEVLCLCLDSSRNSFQVTIHFRFTLHSESCWWPSDAPRLYNYSWLEGFSMFSSRQGASFCTWTGTRWQQICENPNCEFQKASAEILWKSSQKTKRLLHLQDSPDHIDYLDADLVEHQSHPDPAG